MNKSFKEFKITTKISNELAIGLLWGTVCALTLMNVQPLALVESWRLYSQQPGWMFTHFGQLFRAVMLVIGFVVIARIIQHRSGKTTLRQTLIFGTLLSLMYLILILISGWAEYRYGLMLAKEAGRAVDVVGISPHLRNWAFHTVFNNVLPRAINIFACTYAMTREINQRRNII